MVSSFTMLSRVTGLIREMLIAHAFGANQFTDNFYIAFRIPNLLRRITADGAFSQAFVPILTEFKNQRGHDATHALVNATLMVLIWTLGILSLIGIAGAPWVVFALASGLKTNGESFLLTVKMTQIMFPYILFISLTSLVSGVLNTYKQFSLSAFSPVLLNVSFITAIVIAPRHMKQPMYALAWAVIVGGMLQFIAQLPGLKRIDMMPRIIMKPTAVFAHRGLQRVLAKMAPAVFAVSIAQISLMINTNIASHLETGAISWINYADRLMEFPTALFGIALGSILLPNLSRAHVDNDTHEYSALLDWGLRVTFLFTIPSIIMLFFFAEPLTATLFHYGKFDKHAVLMVSRAIAAYGVGLMGLILVKILAPGFYAKQDIITPVKISVAALITTQISNYIFVPIFAHAGLTLSVGLGACMNALLLFIGLRKRGIYTPAPGWMFFFVQLGSASLILASVTHWFSMHFNWIDMHHTPLTRVTLFSICLVLFATLYFSILWLMGFKYAYLRKKTK